MMTDVQQQIDHLKTQIDTGAEETKQYLTKLKKKVEEYDSKHKLSATATSFLQSGIDSACSSVDELKHIGSQLQKQSKTASRETIQTAHTALGNVKDALDGLQCKAREFDRKFASSTGAGAAAGVENVVNATRQRTTDAIEMASEQATRMMEMIQNTASNVAGGAKHTAQVATGETVKAAQVVDEKLSVTPKISGAVSSVTEKVKDLDRRMHVTETAAKIDAKITGGLATKAVHKGVEMVQESIDYVTDTLHHATLVANKSETAQMAEKRAAGAAQTVSDTAGAAQEKAMTAKGQAQEMAGQARDKTVAMAGSAKESVMGAKDKSKDVAGQAGEVASERATQVSEGAKDIAGQAMEKGRDVKEGVMEKGSEAVEGAKGKGSQAMEGAKHAGSQAMEKGSQAKEAVKQKGSDAAETAQETMGSAKDKGSQAMDTAKEKGSQAMGGSSSSSGSGSTMESMKESAKEFGTNVKEVTMGMSSGESATDVRHKEPQQTHTSSGDQGLTEQAAKSACQTASQAKEKMADVASRQKAVMKDATKP